ncbi:hypothetical protein H5410_044351 [Solanum commersonii]|uniref:Protein phosphatase n=1 Tax=Solanum commersonii TaxID=4109 RepID=A0A9J5X8T9_SOLCO|nr:hypothetical protein H5410_044351 [Solanum commersonii]
MNFTSKILNLNDEYIQEQKRVTMYLCPALHCAGRSTESNKRLKFSHDDEFFNVEKRVLEFSSNELPCLKIVAGSLYLPKDNPRKPLGEDAHFIDELFQTIGVTDGVAMKGHVNPKRVLEEAYKNTNSKGSSTACIVTLKSEKSTIVAANVGDSGFFLIRKGKIIYKSPIQQRVFGCPYQLGNCNADNPSIAQEMELNVEKDDILMVGTDGMLDNMNDSKIEEIARRAINENLKAKELAKKIGNIALYNSFNRFADTPYARASKGRHKGGKVDDITVIVAYIQ